MSVSGPATADGRARRRVATAAALAAAGAAFLFAYYDVVVLLVSQWSGNDVYSYGFLIPVMSGFLAWTGRDAIAAAIGKPSLALGVPVTLAGLFALHLGRAGSFGVLAEVSLVVTLAGVVLLTAGARALRATWLPIAYLLFALPIWDIFTDPLHEPFQLLSATIGQGIMRVAGVPSLRTGTLLQLPTVNLEVARACSGVNYLISVVVIAVPYAYLTVSSNLRRAGVGVFAVAVAILSNGLRVALIGILQFYGFSNEADLHGPAHTLQGLFVAVVGYAALFIGARVLEDRHDPEKTPAPPATARVRLGATALTGVALVLGAAGLARPFAQTIPVVLPGAIALPASVGEWQAQGPGDGEIPILWAGADQAAARTYRSSAGSMSVYVGYLSRQEPGRKLVGHGGPGLPAQTGELTIRLRDGTELAAAERVEPSQDGSPAPARLAYWYDVGGSRTASAIEVKGLTVWHSLVRRQSSGAVVVVRLRPGPFATPESARDAIRGFIGELLPSLGRALSAGASAE